jgi:SAM-dependent methyltransferase
MELRPTGDQIDGQAVEQEAVEREAVAQFTVHAESFARSAVINDEQALAVLAELASLTPGDRVVDVACGPGIVSSLLARSGASVVGVDLTPTMVQLATRRAAPDGARFALARMDRLPFPDASFEVTVNRYALHHAADPARVAAELVRVTRPGGRLVIVDFAAPDDPAAAGAYDGAERLRDPSHVRNLRPAEQQALFTGRGCCLVRVVPYQVGARLATVLAGSHGPDHDGVRRAFEASIEGHGLGVGARRLGDDIAFEYPLVAQLFSR